MKKRQLTSLLLAAAMAASTLTGCGSGSGSTPTQAPEKKAEATQAAAAAEAPQEKIELTFFYPIGVGGALATLIENLAADFTKENPDIILHPVFAGDSTETMTKTVSALKGGTPPDFAILPNMELYSLMDMDAVIPLDDYIAKDGGQEYIDDFIPSFLTNSYHEGSIYSIPFQRSSIIMYYNKDHFKAAGLDPEKPPVNWEELQDYAKKLTIKDASGNVEQWGIMITSDDPFIFSAYSRQNGATPDSELMSGDGKAVNFNTPENIEALQRLIDLAKVDGVMPEGSIKWADGPSNFMAGTTSITVTSSGSLTNILDNTDFEVGTAFLPAQRQYGSATGGANIYVFKGIGEEKQDAAWKFIRWITEPERTAQWSIDTGYVATRLSAYETDLMKEHLANVPQAAVAKDQLEYACSELRVHDNQRCIQILRQALESAVNGSSTPEEAFAQAQAEAEKVLADYQ